MKNNQPFTRRFNQSLRAVALSLLFIAASTDVFAAPGDLDPTFGTGGKVITVLPDDNRAQKMAIQPDGKIVVQGRGLLGGNLSTNFLTRYNSNGTLDTGFGTDGTVIISYATTFEDFQHGLAILSDGKILVSGDVYKPLANESDFAVFRFNSNGSRDTSFGTDGVAVAQVSRRDDYGYTMQVQPDGKIVVVGFVRKADPLTSDVGVARFNADGTIDTAFGTNGKLIIAIPTNTNFALAYHFDILPDGKLLLIGRTTNQNNASRKVFLSRINADGTLDTSFGTSGVLLPEFNQLDNFVYQFALQPDGKIVFPTSNSSGGVTQSSTVVRLNPNGTLDTSFGTNGTVVIPTSEGRFGYSVLIQPNGKILAALQTSGAAPIRFAIIRLNADGSRDTSFGSNGIVTTLLASFTNSVSDLKLQPDGKLIACGNVKNSATEESDIGLARYSSGDSPVQRAAPRDFYGTGRSNFYQSTVSNGLRYFSILKNPVTSPEERRVVQWGLPGDRPMNGDFDGDAKTDVAVWREGANTDAQNYYYVQPSSGTSQVTAIPWGKRGDVAGFGYFDDDAKSDVIAIRRENGRLVWYIQLSGGGSRAIAFGFDTDTVSSLGYGFQDFSGDEIADLVVQRIDPNNGNVTLYVGDGRNGNLVFAQQWGNVNGEAPVAYNLANFAGDGRADIVAYYGACPFNCEIGGTWWIKETGNSNYQVVRFGIPFNNQTGEGDTLTSQADYDGDGKFDITVFRRSNNTFYVRRSSDGGLIAQPFGFFPQ